MTISACYPGESVNPTLCVCVSVCVCVCVCVKQAPTETRMAICGSQGGLMTL